MPTDTDLRALLEALEASIKAEADPLGEYHYWECYPKAVEHVLDAMPTIRKLISGEIKLPLECERPKRIYTVGPSGFSVPCGTCDACWINNAIARKP